MHKVTFELDLIMSELINVPMFDDTSCFITVSVSSEPITNYKRIHTSSNNFITKPIPVKNHKVKFGPAGEFKCNFKVYCSVNPNTNSNSNILSSKWLSIGFLLKHSDNSQELLGRVSVNLIDYINEVKPKDLRFLLDKSKTNTICKLNLFIKHLDDDLGIIYEKSSTSSASNLLNSASSSPTIQINGKKPSSTICSNAQSLYQTTSSTISPNSNKSVLSPPSSPNRSSSIPKPRPVTQNGSNSNLNGNMLSRIMSGNGSNSGINNITPNNNDNTRKRSNSNMNRFSFLGNSINLNENNKDYDNDKSIQMMMNEACDEAIKDNSLLDELINKTYRFTWQLKSVQYEEFTPIECIKDIIEHNGNGWRKNEEGFDMVDVIENEFRESRLPLNFKENNDEFDKKINDHKYGGEYDIFAEFKQDKDFNLLDNNSDDSSSNNDDSGSESSDSDDIFYSYYKGTRHKSKIKKFKPLTEAEVREDLRSWKVTSTNVT